MDPAALGIATSLVSAAIAAAAGYSARAARSRARARRVERRFPVSGKYRAVYTENVAHNALRVRDTVDIQQHGYRVTGRAVAVSTGRTFDLTAELIGDRYLSGTYRGRTRGDAGLGVFFMRLDGLDVGRLHGLWAGFGGQFGDILSGSWEWSKIEDVELSDIRSADAPEIATAVALLNDNLGTGYVAADDLRNHLRAEQAVLVCAKRSRELVGAATAEVLTAGEAAALRDELTAAGCRRLSLGDHKVGVLRSSAVLASMRGRGVGLRLVQTRLLFLARLSCTVAYTFAWDSGEQHSSRGVLEGAGFEFVVAISNYWWEPPGEETFACIKCGQPCTCTALVMRRSLISYGDASGEEAL